MTTQHLVDSTQIEEQLLQIWEKLSQKNKIRSSLFNLIIFNHLSTRTDYFRSVVQKVVEKFPCRILFISFDAATSQPQLKTAVSVVMPQGEESSAACDQIDIGVSGSDLEKVPFLLLPHLLPDLPIYLLWTEDPSRPHPLFEPLAQLATRIIFDSEAADDLILFAQTLLSLKEKAAVDIADLNWARTEGWRELLASTFDVQERLQELPFLSSIAFHYNARPTEFFCHLKTQGAYLIAWLASCLHWKSVANPKKLLFCFEGVQSKVTARLQGEDWEHLGPGTLTAIHLLTTGGFSLDATRLSDQYHRVKILIASNEKCELPYQFTLGKTATGQSLVQEISTKGTSSHYLKMLQELAHFPKRSLC